MEYEKQCAECGQSFTHKLERVRFCSQSCARKFEWRSKPRSGSNYVFERNPGHPLADATGNVRVHRRVLYDAIGAGEHPCHWCGSTVSWDLRGSQRGALVVDHLDSNVRNNEIENLVPSCHKCNIWRNPPRDLVRDDELFIVVQGHRRRAAERTCEVCGAKFLTQRTLKPGQGRFCSRPCAGVGRMRDRVS